MAGSQLEMSAFRPETARARRTACYAEITTSTSHTSQCRNCGKEWPHENDPCPAHGKECHQCRKLNHFAKFADPQNLILTQQTLC